MTVTPIDITPLIMPGPGTTPDEWLERMLVDHAARDVRIAIHEAAHLVAMNELGGSQIAYVSLGDTRQLANYALGPSVAMCGGRETVEGVRRLMITCSAARAAVYRFDPNANPGDGGDRQDMRRHARTLHGLVAPDDVIRDEMALADRRADAFIRRSWGMIVWYAHDLLTLHTRLRASGVVDRLESLDVAATDDTSRRDVIGKDHNGNH